jgi:hypothetical protein
MTCEKIREQLTAYLDGELEGDRGTPVRGHLRTCEACRQIATDEAALRDGLRSLPPLDPPPTMWAGIQAQLAEAEVAESKRPAWRRALTRWAPLAPRFGMLTGALAAAAVLLVWRAHRRDELAPAPVAQQDVVVKVPPAPPAPAPAPPGGDDVTDDLAASAARVTDDYATAAKELLETARAEAAQWPADRQQAFAERVAELQAAVDAATEGHPRQRAYRAMIRYLQRAAVHEEVALR